MATNSYIYILLPVYYIYRYLYDILYVHVLYGRSKTLSARVVPYNNIINDDNNIMV